MYNRAVIRAARLYICFGAFVLASVLAAPTSTPTRRVVYRCDGTTNLVVTYAADTATFWHAGKKRNLKMLSKEPGEVRYRENFYEWQVHGKEASLLNIGTYYYIFSKCVTK